MAKSLYTTKPLSSGAQTAAAVSVTAAIVFLLLLILLHFIKSDVSPSWHFVSEYSIGKYGWVMQIAFVTLALAVFSAVLAIKSQVATTLGKIGLVLGVIASIAMTAAAFFTIDPVTATKAEMTTHGSIHGLTAIVGNPSFVLAALFISLSLVRNKAWASARGLILFTANLPWIALLVMMGTLFATLPKDGTFSPDVLIGWPNRILLVTYVIWLVVIGWHAMKLRMQKV